MGADFLKLILLLFPGLIALYVYELIVGDVKKSSSDLDRFVKALLFGAPALILTWLAINVFRLRAGEAVAVSISELTRQLDYLPITIVYILLGSLTGSIIGYLCAGQEKQDSLLSKLLDWATSRQGRPFSRPPVWYNVVANNDQVVELVKPNGDKTKGFIKGFSYPNDENRELTLEHLDVAERFSEYFQDVIETYYHFQSGVMIKKYDMSKFKEMCHSYQNGKEIIS